MEAAYQCQSDIQKMYLPRSNVEELMLVLKVISVGFCSFQLFQQQIIKKGEAETRNEVSRDHRHLLFDSVCLKCMFKVALYFGDVNNDLPAIVFYITKIALAF